MITSKHIMLILMRVMDNGITTHTNRVRSILHAAFQHALKQDNDPRRYADEGVLFNLVFNPVSAIPKQADFEKVGDHVILEDEIQTIWDKLPEESTVIANVVKLAFLTGQRPGEIIRTRIKDYNTEEKTLLIPSSVSKNGVDHLVPLNNLAMALVKQIIKGSESDDYAFPGTIAGNIRKDVHINNTTIGKTVRLFCDETDHVTKFVPRDIRRTVKTLMGNAGKPGRNYCFISEIIFLSLLKVTLLCAPS